MQYFISIYQFNRKFGFKSYNPEVIQINLQNTQKVCIQRKTNTLFYFTVAMTKYWSKWSSTDQKKQMAKKEEQMAKK